MQQNHHCHVGLSLMNDSNFRFISTSNVRDRHALHLYLCENIIDESLAHLTLQHNIIQIHNNVLWDWQYFVEVS